MHGCDPVCLYSRLFIDSIGGYSGVIQGHADTGSFRRFGRGERLP